MNPSLQASPSVLFPDRDAALQLLWQDGERVLWRGWRPASGDRQPPLLAVSLVADDPARSSLERLAHEFALREELGADWAVRPVDLVRNGTKPVLLLEDPGGEPLERLLGAPMELGRFLHIAVAMTSALARMHARGMVHKDIKPAHVFVDGAGHARLTGFGIATRLSRERQVPQAPEEIAGTLAYMAPEQTGRMNRSIDSRSDLYALGVTLYQMLVGALPFTASDPMGWVHAHIARRATPPAERVDVPAVVSAIVMRFLEKTAEDRYQTAAGAMADLQRCLVAHQANGRVEAFPLGAQDVPEVLRIPEKLYGREEEVASLVAAFERVVARGTPELVLVSGYSGIGKSSVVGELHKVIVPQRGLFASGKFEQYRRDVPYATLAQAFQGLVRQVLARSEPEVELWRSALCEALGGDGELMVRIIPDLALLIGDPPAVPELPARKAQARFQRVFRRMLGVFARPEHPLVLFLDDMQWMDAGSLTLLADFATQHEVQHLLLVGAYRDNEVDASHALTRSLDDIRAAGVPVSAIVPAPLTLDDVGALVADALHDTIDRARPLADLVHEKTGGNPFFAIQFLAALAEEKLLTFDRRTGAWVADLERIQVKGYTDNVIDLVVAKLDRLSADTRSFLEQLACLGNLARFSALARIFGQPADAVHAALWPAVRDGLVVRMPGSYAFVHDRVQEAAYSLIPRGHRPGIHLRIGRALLAEMHADEVIDVVDQLNRAADMLADAQERLRVAELNLRAGRKAKSSTAYASACTYLSAGIALLPEDAWSRCYELAFGLWLERAECEFMCGNGDHVEPLIAQLLAKGASRIDKAAAYRLKIDLHVMRSEYPEAVATALECLRLFGIDMPPHPTREQVDAEYEKVWRNLGERPIESLIDLPSMTDPDVQAAMGVLAVLNSPAYFTDASLVRLHLCHMVNLTLTHGLSEASPHALALLGRRYAWFDLPSGWHVARYADAYRFGKLACDLVDKLGLPASRAKVDFSMALTAVWTQPASVAVDAMRPAHRTAVESGDVTIACYACHHLVADLLLRGDPLDEVWRETERSLEFVRKAGFRDVVDVLVTQQRFVQALRGRTAHFATFTGTGFDEGVFEAGFPAASMTMMVCLYWVLQQQARYLSGDHAAARQAARNADAVLWSVDGHIMLLDHCFYGALAACAAWHSLSPGEQEMAGKELEVQLRQLSEWAERGAVTFRDRHLLAKAEVARIAGRELEAERLYEDAIRLSREHRFVQNEALGHELAGRFHAARGFEDFAMLHLRKARNAYRRWGAEGKVRHLAQEWPALAEEERVVSPMTTIGAPIEQFDLATVVRVSQAVSGEIVLEKMLGTIMRTAIEHAGAERGLLLLAEGAEQRAAAEATTSGDIVVVQLCVAGSGEPRLPRSVLQHVVHTLETVVLDDACRQSPFAADPDVRERGVRSLLCLPLVKQGGLVGMLYLENNLAPGAFAPGRLAVLKLLASQAAISLENARLYLELAQREAKIRRLVDANIIGVFFWDFAGRILEANDAFLAIIGHDRGALTEGGLRWTDLTPADWAERDRQRFAPELQANGSLHPYEKEFFRKDGSRVPVLIGAALLEEGGRQGVAFVLDLSERKRAEAEARERQRGNHEMQMRLADSNRLASIGQLTAAIVHEINQPLAAAVTNANTCVRRLEADTPNLPGAAEAARRLIRDANRASDVVSRLRAMFARKEVATEQVDLNDAAGEVVALSSAALQEAGVVVHCEFAADLPLVQADRIQLQQVMMNLVRNAADAMRGVAEGTRALAIRTRLADDGNVQLTVEDSGVGLDVKQVDKLFDAFYTTKSGGMGVGLSVSRSILERYQGRLWAEAKDGPGASFSFAIPAAAGPAGVASGSRGPASSPS